MGFSVVKQEVIEALLSGDYGHEVRGDIEIKNLLSTGAVTVATVVDIINRLLKYPHSRSTPNP